MTRLGSAGRASKHSRTLRHDLSRRGNHFVSYCPSVFAFFCGWRGGSGTVTAARAGHERRRATEPRSHELATADRLYPLPSAHASADGDPGGSQCRGMGSPRAGRRTMQPPGMTATPRHAVATLYDGAAALEPPRCAGDGLPRPSGWRAGISALSRQYSPGAADRSSGHRRGARRR